jgi:hypothetical protein
MLGRYLIRGATGEPHIHWSDVVGWNARLRRVCGGPCGIALAFVRKRPVEFQIASSLMFE